MWSRDNARKRIFDWAVARADEKLEAAGFAPLPERLSPHSLRHTYISLRVALGTIRRPSRRTRRHADMAVTFRIYTHVMHLNEGDRERLRALVNGSVFGTERHWSPGQGSDSSSAKSLQDAENPADAGLSEGSWGETRTPDLTIMSRAL